MTRVHLPLASTPGTADAAQRHLVWLVWGTALVAALWLVWSFGPPFPYEDDLNLTPQVTGEAPVGLRWLWIGYQDHRFPLAWAVLCGTHVLAHGEHRVAMTLDVLFLAGVSAALIACLRRIRGRTSWTDAGLALAWLQLGHWRNLLLSFQLWLFLSMALVALWLAGFAVWRAPLRWRRAVAGAAILCALPLLAGSGALATPPMAAAGLLMAFIEWRRGSRLPALILACGALVALAVFGAYLHGFERQFLEQADDRWSSRFATGARFVALALGPARWEHWQLPATLVALVLIATLALLLRTWIARPDERVRATALIGGLGVVASLCVGVGWGRTTEDGAGGADVRYLALLLPLPTVAFLTWELYGPARIKRVVLALLALASCAAAIRGAFEAVAGARELSARARTLEADVAAGLNSTDLAMRHLDWLFPDPLVLGRALASLRRARMPPFDGAGAGPEVDLERVGPFRSFSHQPRSGRPSQRIHSTQLGGREVAVVGEPGEMVWLVPSDARCLDARFGLMAEAARKRRSDGLVFAVELRESGAAPRVLFEQDVVPVPGGEVQPEHALAIELHAGVGAVLALVTRNAPGKNERWDRGYWADVRFR